MALIPNFDRIVATITASDVEKFLRSAAPEDDKQRVLNAKTDEIRMRLVGGYLIRTNQITPERLTGRGVKAKTARAAAGAKASHSAGTAKSPRVSPAAE